MQKNNDDKMTTQFRLVSKANLKRNPIISIVIPVYNTEKYINQCLQSLLQQSFQDFEIICIDDGSQDNSLNILKKFSTFDNRITVITQQPKGAGAARNIGLSLAKGKYISFLDSDDFFEYNYLETMFSLINKNLADIAICGYNVYDDKKGKITSFVEVPQLYKNKVFLSKSLADCIFTITNPNAWTKMYNRKMLINEKITFEELQSANDITFVCMAFAVSKKIVFSDKRLINYRINRDGAILNTRGRKLENFLSAIMALKKNLEDKQLFSIYEKAFNDRILKSGIYELNNSTHKSYSKVKINIASYLDVKQREYFFSKLKPAVTVIISAYNAEKFIDECLNSVINQTFKNIEIICIDDGSNDATLNKLISYSQNDRRIVLLSRRNLGVSASRNHALSIATGKYICFIDADDYIDLDTIKILYEKAEKYQCEMINYAGICFEDCSNNKIDNNYYTIFYTSKDKEILSSEDLAKVYLMIPTSCCRMFYLKDFLISNKIYFPENLRFEDNFFIKKALLHAKSMGVEHRPLYYRRQHTSQLTYNWIKYFSDYIKVMEKIAVLLSRHDTGYQYLKKFSQMTISTIKHRISTSDIANKEDYIENINSFKKFTDSLVENSVKNNILAVHSTTIDDAKLNKLRDHIKISNQIIKYCSKMNDHVFLQKFMSIEQKIIMHYIRYM